MLLLVLMLVPVLVLVLVLLLLYPWQAGLPCPRAFLLPLLLLPVVLLPVDGRSRQLYLLSASCLPSPQLALLRRLL